MLLIDSRILIIHMRKCGGTSFCTGLIEQLPPERVFYLGYTPEGEKRSAEYRRRPGQVWKHATAATIIKGLKLDPAKLEIHLLALRPWWDRVASFYFHAQRYHHQDGRKYPWVDNMSFSEYLRSTHLNTDRLTDYACALDGSCLVNHFIRFDALDDAYRRLCAELGLHGQGIPHLNANSVKEHSIGDKELRALYSPADWEVVQPYFQPEIDFIAELGL